MAVSFGPKAGVHAGTRTICAIFLFPFFVPSSTYPWHLPHTGKEVEFLVFTASKMFLYSFLSMRRTILFARQLGRNRPFYCPATGESLIYFRSSASDKERRSDRVAYCHAFGRAWTAQVFSDGQALFGRTLAERVVNRQRYGRARRVLVQLLHNDFEQPEKG